MRSSEKPFLHADSQAEQPFASKFAGQAACSSSQIGSYQPLTASQAERMASKGMHPGARQPSDKQVTSCQLADTKLSISISTLTDSEVAM